MTAAPSPASPRGSLQSRLLRLAVLLSPVVFLLWLYREGLDIWFMQDDFAWLGLLRQVHSPSDVIRVLFEPAAQGTIRPWSERGFFLLFEYLFGLDSFPFRVTAFATAAADILLIGWIIRRLTGSMVAGAVAGICWAANASLVVAMTWSSAWNELLCPCFLLTALVLFIRFVETGRAVFWWWQLVVFLLGFGVLEINVVYPAIAISWVLFVVQAERRRFLLSQIPLCVLSVIYFGIHRAVAPLQTSGAYALHFDTEILKTLALYAKWSLVPADWVAWKHSVLSGRLILASGVVGILALLVVELRRRRTVILFFAAWFLATLAPLLPLSGHRSDYYLTIPVIAVGMLAGWSVGCALDDKNTAVSRRAWQTVSVICVGVYLVGMVPVARTATAWWWVRAESVRSLVLGVEAAHRTHPDAVIVLDGVNTELFNNAIGHSPFYPLGLDKVYLTPGSAAKIEAVPDLAEFRDVELDPVVLQHALTTNRAVIYSIAGDHLRNITESYKRSAPDPLVGRLPRRIDVGNALYSWLVGPEWLPLETGFRWMPARATVRISGPDVGGNELSLDGYCPEEQLKRAPRHITVLMDGIVLGHSQIINPESTFHRRFHIPDSLIGKKAVEVEIRVDPVSRIGNRELGLIFGRIEILP